MANTIDPLAGSYYIESLTNEIERRAQLYLDKIESLGGTLRAIEQGYIQQEIQNAAYDFQQGVDRLENVVVGVNRFQTEGEKSVPVLRIDEALEGRQVERVRALRQRRDKAKWEAAHPRRGRSRPRRPEPDAAHHSRRGELLHRRRNL